MITEKWNLTKSFAKISQNSGKYKKTAAYVFLALTIRWGVAEAYRIPSESMNPTLKPGDFVIVNKAQYGVRLPFTKTWLFETGPVVRGDVVVFRYPKDESTFYVKRVVGLPGDQVFISSEGHVFVNGQLQSEEHTAKKLPDTIGGPKNSLNPYGPVLVPEDSLLVLGDNRDNSSDSRVWGFVPKNVLMGKVAFKLFSWVD